MKSEHRYGSLVVLMAIAFLVFIVLAIIFIIKNFATGEWELTSSVSAIFGAVIAATFTVVFSRLFDLIFTSKIVKADKIETIKIQLLDSLGEFYKNQSDENYNNLFLIYQKSKLYLNSEVVQLVSTILNSRCISIDDFDEVTEKIVKWHY